MAIFMFTKLYIQVAEAQLTSEPFLAKPPKPLPEGLCMNYFSVVVVRYHGQRQLTEAKVYFDLWFQRDKSPSWQRGMTVSNRHGGRARNTRDHLFNYKHETERLNWNAAVYFPSPTPLTYFLQQDQVSYTSPTSVTN